MKMAKKQNKNSERMLFAALMFVGCGMFFAPQSLTDKLQFAFIRVFSKPLSICRNFTVAATNRQSSANVVDQPQYLKLRNQLANNKQWLRQESRNVERLSGLRSRSVWKGVDFVIADIITASTGISRNEFVINRGEDDGLAKGQFVSNDHSVVGIIADLGSRTARVQMLTDARSKVLVKVGELDLQCIMRGNGDGSAGIELVSKKYNIKNGDIIYVQKKPGFLNVPMVAGTITHCETNDENPLLWEIEIEPVYHIKDMKTVTVIINGFTEIR